MAVRTLKASSHSCALLRGACELRTSALSRSSLIFSKCFFVSFIFLMSLQNQNGHSVFQTMPWKADHPRHTHTLWYIIWDNTHFCRHDTREYQETKLFLLLYHCGIKYILMYFLNPNISKCCWWDHFKCKM